MHPLKSIGIKGLSPILQSSACRFAPLFSQHGLRPQCLPFNPQTTNIPGDLRSLSRPFSNSPSRPSTKSSQLVGFDYRIGASFCAKNQRFNPSHDSFSFDPAGLEKEVVTGRPGSGQDAFFTSKIGNSNNVAFGIADGVGGWSDSGIDSAHFSHGLCRYMAKSAREAGELAGNYTVRELLHKGYEGVVADRDIPGGGSTACVAVAENDGNMEVANLGDSGFIQLRLNAVHFYSNPQTHAFNTPFQMSIIPPKILARSRALGGEPLSDHPKDASVTGHQVKHGDVLIFATDGVWDNLSAQDLLKLVSRQMQDVQAWVLGGKGLRVGDMLSKLTQHGSGNKKLGNNTLQTALAISVTAKAKSASMDAFVDGPFAKEVQKYHPDDDFMGGKLDDICVVVVVVVEGKQDES